MPSFEGLPEGPLRIGLVSHELTGDYPRRIDVRQVRIELEGWDRREIERFASRLAEYNRTHAVVVTPQREPERWVGFRNVEAGQLEAMQRDGFEPAWVVKAGERFDVLLKAPSPLTPEESRQLKYHLTAKYELTLPQGVFRDAVRLPGFEAERAKPASRVELVEASERSFSAGERVLTQLRNREEHVHIARWARAQPLSAWHEKQSVTVLSRDTETAASLPASHPVAELERRLFEAFTQAQPKDTFRGFPTPELERRVEGDQLQLLDSLRERPSLDSTISPALHELAVAQRELLERRLERTDFLAGEELLVSSGRREIAHATREVFRQPDSTTFERYHEAIASAYQSEETWKSSRLAELHSERLEVSLQVDRLEAAVMISPRDERVHEAFRWGAEREARVLFSHGESPLKPDAAASSLAEMKANLATLAAREAVISTGIRAIGRESSHEVAPRLKEWRQLVSERVELQQAIRYAELGAKVQASTLERDAALFTTPEPALSSLTYHLRALADWNAAAPATSVRPGTPQAETQALETVARGDVSPRALNRMQGELLASVGEAAVPLPLKPHKESDPLELLKSFVRLENEVRQWASDMSARPPWFDGGAQHLIAKSAELIQVQQAVEKLERRQYGVAEPSPAPDGISQATWDRAWLKRAEEKHLPQPERHLGNIGPALAPRELAMERAAALKMAEVKVVERLVPELSRGAVLK